MHFNVIAATLLAAAPLALAQSATAPTATSTASGKVITMMWDNESTSGAAPTSGAPKKAAGMSGMSMGASMTMSDGKVMSAMSGMSGMSMSTATGTAMAGMNMTGAAGRMELAPSAMGVGWIVISLGAGIGFLAGAL